MDARAKVTVPFHYKGVKYSLLFVIFIFLSGVVSSQEVSFYRDIEPILQRSC